MATINFESRGSTSAHGGKSGPSVSSAVNTAGIAGWSFDRTVTVTAALSATLGVAKGIYEHVGEDSSGNWTYAPVDRGH